MIIHMLITFLVERLLFNSEQRVRKGENARYERHWEMLYSPVFLTCLVQSIKNGLCIVVNNKYIFIQ